MRERVHETIMSKHFLSSVVVHCDGMAMLEEEGGDRGAKRWRACFFVAGIRVHLYPTSFMRPSEVSDFGRSMGRPRARSQMSDERTPRARDTPNRTV